RVFLTPCLSWRTIGKPVAWQEALCGPAAREDIMGAWGSAPWDNDLAADWFGELFEATKLARRVEKTLNHRDLEEYAPEIRAAACLLIARGPTHGGPADDLERHLTLAISRLEAIRELADYEGMPEIDQEIAILRSRLEAPNAIDLAGERRDLINGLRDPA